MIETETTDERNEIAVSRETVSAGWGPFRRREMSRVLVTCGFILATIWSISYAGLAGDLAEAYRDKHLSPPLGRLLDPLLVARAFPSAVAFVLGAVAGFFAMLRLKAAAPLERTILRALASNAGSAGQAGWTGESVEEISNELRDPTVHVDNGLEGPSHKPSRIWPWIAAGLIFVAAAIAILEWMQPCYFVQDDNFANVLPGILQGCRAMFHGEFPDFDPCQYMGMPNAGKGLFTLFYPPTIASYATARYVLGNENWTLDVFAAMHLLVGYLASFAAARRAGLRPALAFALAISFVLSGYILLVGRGWHAVLTLVVWLPLLFCSMEAWLDGRTGWRWLIASGLAIGGFYYTGFPQYWIYAMLFMGATAVAAVTGGRVAARRLIWPAAAVLLGISLILPNLLVQLEITHGMTEKQANFGAGFDRGLVATIVPYPLSEAEGFMPLPANREKELQNQWYFAGPILMAAGYLVLGVLLAYRCSSRWLARQPWIAAALLSLWLGMGSAGLLWTAMGRLPIIRAVNHHPHRLLPFFVFFTLVIGGRLIEQLLRRTTARKWEYAIAAVTAALMLYHVSLARNSFWSYGDRPYPPLPAEVAQRVLPAENPQAGRFLWIGPWRSGEPGYANLLPHSLPSAYGALAVNGYDPIIAGRPETVAQQARLDEQPLAAARAYGVRWLLVANPKHYRPERGYWQSVWKNDWCIGYMDSAMTTAADKVLPAAQLRVDREDLRLYELSGASPMAFDERRPDVPLLVRFCGWGAEVASPDGGERSVVVNMAMRPWVQAASGGRSLAVAADAWGRAEVRVPEGVTQFQVFYRLPWRRGLLVGAMLMLSTIIGMVFWQSWAKNQHLKHKRSDL